MGAVSRLRQQHESCTGCARLRCAAARPAASAKATVWATVTRRAADGGQPGQFGPAPGGVVAVQGRQDAEFSGGRVGDRHDAARAATQFNRCEQGALPAASKTRPCSPFASAPRRLLRSGAGWSTRMHARCGRSFARPRRRVLRPALRETWPTVQQPPGGCTVPSEVGAAGLLHPVRDLVGLPDHHDRADRSQTINRHRVMPPTGRSGRPELPRWCTLSWRT